MVTCATPIAAANAPETGALLYVTDLMHDSDEHLQLACELASSRGLRLELVHVIDLNQTPSRPDAQMGIQHRLDALVRRLKPHKKNVRSVLLFGCPEEVISKRAIDLKASLIAFGAKSAASAEVQWRLVRSVIGKTTCPVLVLSSDLSIKKRKTA
ncbi:MAG TPA: universal stress protein [Acidisarcina sp.]|nr:universal stress protein [Acidisarcina sp.]